MRRKAPALATLIACGLLCVARPAFAHPMGNFSISHYAGLRIERDAIRLRYLIDMAEIPTFQAIQEAALTPEPDHPSARAYLARTTEALKKRLQLEVDGRRLALRSESAEIIFPPGAGGLPTLKIGVVYRAPLGDRPSPPPRELRYRDANFPDRTGWKEIVAGAGPGVALLESSAPERDRSRELSDYPTDLLSAPPQDLEAVVVFTREPASVAAGTDPPTSPTGSAGRAPAPTLPPAPAATQDPAPIAVPGPDPARLEANRQATPRSAFTELITRRELGRGVVLLAMLVAASLGAFHALEPGHGKTVVAAYLVGSRGTAWHALALGLIVTASHTAGVYLLGAVTLYASRYVVPERLYPWLGVASGLTVAVLGVVLFLRRYVGAGHADHDHGHAGHDHAHDLSHRDQPHHHGHAHRHGPDGPVSLRALLALGITGGIVPCPAALVVLLSAVALRRIGFGLLLIVAFSVGLAAVLIGIGLLMVYARRFMARLSGEGHVITRWLPLTSAAVITVSGVVIVVRALLSAGIVQIRL